MHIVVVYATVEGQTRKIARAISGTVQGAGHDVATYDAADLADVDLDLADAVIIAAPVHAGAYPAAIEHWLREKSGALNRMKTAFVSVSLSSASIFDEERKEIAGITQELLSETGWQPVAIHQAAGALRYTRYNYLKRLLMRHIALKEGAPQDTTQDHEFTDWTKLAEFVEEFIAAA